MRLSYYIFFFTAVTLSDIKNQLFSNRIQRRYKWKGKGSEKHTPVIFLDHNLNNVINDSVDA